MKADIAISVQSVSKTFRLPHEKNTSIKNSLVNFRKRKKGYEQQQVLTDISFEVKKGEFFGIVGRNGGGKSTLLKLLSGIYTPDSGSIEIHGKLTPFIELGVGFNPELSGRENIFLNGALLGFNRNEMLAMYDDIVEFAELERFMDQKLKNYSSGMQVRLAFSIAIKANTDILLLDEVLAVGDAAFQRKCFDFFRKLKKDKKTVILITHDMNAIREYCDRALLIEKGKVVHEGSPDDVAESYVKLFTVKQKNTTHQVESANNRWGTNEAVVNDITITDTSESVTIKVLCTFRTEVARPIFGMTIKSPIGTKIFESNTRWKKYRTKTYYSGDTAEVTWVIPNIFTNGLNSVSVAIANSDATTFYDNWEDAVSFRINKDEVTTAVALPAATVVAK